MDGSTVLLAAGSAFAGSLGINSLLVRVARRRGWYDRPDSRLKTHGRPVPFIGGLGVLLGLGLATAFFGRADTRLAVAWLAAGALAFAVGLWDDIKWKAAVVPVPKLAIQALVAMAAGALLLMAGIRVAEQPFVSFALGAAFVLGGMNALNLEDGMDGLAAGEGAISALGLAVLLLVLGRGGAALALGLAGALAGFLVLNWHPARMFLGDGGSHVTGAMLALLALSACSGRGWCALAAAALVIGLPVVDTAWVIARRLFSGERVMAGGRDHLYDLMHRAGLSVRLTVLLCWLVQALLVAGGVIMLRRAQ